MRAFKELSGSGGRMQATQSNAAGRNAQQRFALRAMNDGRTSRQAASQFSVPKKDCLRLVGSMERQQR
jgi:hypothetical protein